MLETFGVRSVCVVPELGFIDCVKYQKVGEFLVGLRLRNVCREMFLMQLGWKWKVVWKPCSREQLLSGKL